jgi:hypothetical protein
LCGINKRRIFRNKDEKREYGPDSAVSYFVIFQQRSSLLGSEDHVFSDSGLAEVHSLREKAVREDIARRLRHACSCFPPEEFEDLVSLMAARQVKGERRSTW